MKKIDKDGLSLCKLQGDVFVSSLDNTNCSSEIFMRRFMTSKISKEFDSLAILDDSLTILEIIQKIDDEFGKTSYGRIKYEKEVMFWIGYIYRYFAYTYDLSSKFVYKIIKPKELNERYYVYHSFDPSIAIERILDEKNLSFDLDVQNKQLLKLLRKRLYGKELTLEKMTTKYAHELFKDFKNDYSLFKKETDFKEYFYSKEKVDSYVSKEEKEGYNLFAIKYKDEIIGEIRFKKLDFDVYELKIVLKDVKYKNKGIGTVAIDKALLYAKNQNIKIVVVQILKNDQRSIHVFKNIGFKYDKEDNDFVYLAKNI